MKNRLSLPLAVLLVVLAVPSFATVFRPTTDRQLVDRSDAVVIGTVRDSVSRLRADGYVVTETHLIVEETLKGHAGDLVTVLELGGVAGSHVTFIADSAAYAPGERVVAFLRQRPDHTWYTASMALGKFVVQKELAVRESDEQGTEGRNVRALAQFVRAVAAGSNVTENSSVAVPPTRTARIQGDAHLKTTNGNAKNYALLASGLPVRWPGCENPCSVPFKIHNGPDPGGVGLARSSWTNDPGAQINLTDGGTSASPAPAAFTGSGDENVIYLNYSGSFSGPGFSCDGAQACTIGTGGFTHTFDGDTWVSIGDVDIVVSGVTGGAFNSLLTHELGHAIGLRHSDQGSPTSSNAIMNSSVPVIYGTTLQQWDKDAVDSLYGTGPLCVTPTVTGTTGGGTVAAGSMANLTVSATGSGPLHYQWYSGTAPSTANPVGTDSTSYQTPPINASSDFWVKVTNTCGSANSPTITVTPAVCQQPTISLQPAGTTVSSGGSASLQVGHNGTPPYSYQWFEGASGDTTHPVSGATDRTFTTPALTHNTSYWVRVSNTCGTVNSSAATITVQGDHTCGDNPSITRQPQGLNLGAADVTYLIAGASNVTSYHWYRGAVGDTSNPIASSTPSNARFVIQAYIDLFDNLGLADPSLVAQLDASSITRTGAATTILKSAPYRTLLVNGYYRTFLRRAPSAAELAFWLPAFDAGMNDEQIESQFLGSTEYFTLAGGTNSAWLAQVYSDLLNRAPNAFEIASYTPLLSSGSRTAVALSILNSNEARTVRVQGYYSRYLRRAADAPSLASFVGLLGSSTDEQVQALILAADEYFNFPSIAIVGPLATTTNFWVQAVNACGTTNSNAAQVIIPNCPAPSITKQPSSLTANLGETPPLTVIATGATSYQWYRASAPDPSNPIAGATGPILTNAPANNVGPTNYWVKVTNECGSVASNTVTATTNCVAPKLDLTVQPTVSATSSYVISWSPAYAAIAFRYDLQESATPDFANPTEFQTTATSFTIPAKGSAVTSDTRFYYRLRLDPLCGGLGDFGPTASVLVLAPPASNTQPTNLSPTAPPCAVASCTVNTTFFISGFPPASGKTALANDDTYAVTSDKPFVTVTPASGPLPPGGVTVNVSINTSGLDAGSFECTLNVTKTQNASGKIGATATSSGSVPVSVNLVTPVTPKPKDSNPPLNAMIIPAVAHADGIGSHFQSDVRITNTSAQSITYQLTYTPTATDGTTVGKTSTLTIAGGDTKALNDVVEAWYGSGAAGEGGVGTLEIRPQNTSAKIGDVNVSLATVASSRTYNVTSNGTFGQFIPAISLTSFLAKSDVSKLSLQQIEQSSAYRTNLGFVEGAGQPVDMLLTLFDTQGSQVALRTYSLRPFEHQQQNLSSLFPGVTLADGRLEVKVTSDGGKVTTYASVLNNVTSDPLLVFPVDPSKVSTTRVVVPGVAELNNGAANFHSDMRIFNGGSSDATVTLTYTNADVPQKQITVKAGEIASYNDTLKTLWGLTGSGGAIIATTDAATPIVVTARTFSRRDDGGTFGQFIPGVTATDATGVGERPLQVVQLEQSPAFRSNLGLVEVTGNAVILDIAAFTPDSKVAAHVQKTLNANEFTQLGSVFSQLGFGNTYNGRIAVSVIGGAGRVAAYGSVIDNRTQDPTYVPAQ